MEHTTNHQLSQWESTDRIQMQDFNSDNAKIDAALAALSAASARHGNCQIYFINYTGVGNGVKQTITFPHRPVLVILTDNSGSAAHCFYGSEQSRVHTSGSNNFWIKWEGNSLSWTTLDLNNKGTLYHALALCARD